MAKKNCFDSGMVVRELYGKGAARCSKGKYILTKIENIVESFLRNDTASPSTITPHDTLQSLTNRGVLKSRAKLVLKNDKPVLTFRTNGIMLYCDIVETMNEHTGVVMSVRSMGQTRVLNIISSDQLASFLMKIDTKMGQWLKDWEKLLYQSWQKANTMTLANGSINEYLKERLSDADLTYSFKLEVDKSVVKINLLRGLSLEAVVPNDDFYYQVDLLISQALVFNMQLKALPDEIEIKKN